MPRKSIKQDGLLSPSILGNPFHGRVTNNMLATSGYVTLPTGRQKTFSGYTLQGTPDVIRPPAGSLPQRSVAEQESDSAKGYQWLDYALWARGASNLENGTIDGYIQTDGNVVYCDSFSCWSISVEFDWPANFGTPAETFSITLNSRIGDNTSIAKTLATVPLTSRNGNEETMLYSGVNEEWGAVIYARNNSFFSRDSLVVTQTEAGGKVVVCHYRLSTTNGYTFPFYAPTFSFSTSPFYTALGYLYQHILIGVYVVSINGNGSVDIATLGNGISASCSLYKNFYELYSFSVDETHPDLPVIVEGGAVTCGESGISFTQRWSYLWHPDPVSGDMRETFLSWHVDYGLANEETSPCDSGLSVTEWFVTAEWGFGENSYSRNFYRYVGIINPAYSDLPQFDTITIGSRTNYYYQFTVYTSAGGLCLSLPDSKKSIYDRHGNSRESIHLLTACAFHPITGQYASELNTSSIISYIQPGWV